MHLENNKVLRETSRYKIPLSYKNEVKSLCWADDFLVDFAGGLATFQLDGKVGGVKVNFAYRFDIATATSDGMYAVIYEKLGTKGLVLKQGNLIREINRSFYHADVYEYPVVIFRHNEKTCLAHCPEHYNIIEVEEIETGERLTAKERPSNDFFQSRLQVSPNGKWLLSAGWIWQPIDAIELFDLSADISEPQVFSPFWGDSPKDIGLWEMNNAAFTSDSKLLISGTGNAKEQDDDEEMAIVTYDLTEKRIVSRAVMSEPTGKLMPLDDTFAVGFYENPKLINFVTGEIVHKWIEIPTDKQNSSIDRSEDFSHIALDQKGKRFAVATEDNIEVLVFE